MRLKGPLKKGRRRAYSGAFYVKEHRGQLIVCKWPAKRKRVTHPTTQEQNEQFRQTQWAIKYMPARIQAYHRRITEGTPLLPRDLLTGGMYGRITNPGSRQEPRLYSMAARNDLSEVLDLFGFSEGAMLYRGPDYWAAAFPTEAGQVPVSGGPGEPIAFQTLTGSGGSWQIIQETTLTSDLALNEKVSINFPSTWLELDLTWFFPFNATGINPQLQFASDTGSKYTGSRVDLSSAIGLVGNTYGPATAIPWFRAAHAPNQGSGTGHAFIQGNASNVNAYIHTDLRGGNNLGAKGWHTFSAAASAITSLQLFSSSGVGLRSGTRIILKATLAEEE